MYSLSYYVDGSGTVTGGVSEVENKKDRSYYASKALQELEKSSDNSNARKIVEVIKKFNNKSLYIRINEK